MLSVPIKGSLTIANIAQCKAEIIDALEKNEGDIHFDFENIEDCDSSGVQLLIATRIHAGKNKRTVAFDNVSEPITRAFSIAGVEDVNEYFSAIQSTIQ